MGVSGARAPVPGPANREVVVVALPIEVATDAGPVLRPGRIHLADCPLAPLDTLVRQRFETVEAAEAALGAAFGTSAGVWGRCEVCAEPGDRPSLEPLRRALDEASRASPSDRINYRNVIAGFGLAGISAIEPWLTDPRMASFAVRVVEAAAAVTPDAARAALTTAANSSPEPAASDARAALKRLGAVIPTWPRSPAYARHVAFVGDGPFMAADLIRHAPNRALVRAIDDDGFIDTVVLGSAATVDRSVLRRESQEPRPARFLPQEAWIELLLFGADWWLDDADRLNAAVELHRPLRMIRDSWPSAFRWPGVEPPGTGPVATPELIGESDLHRLGYRITNMSRSQRWKVLTSIAVPTLGLESVAYTIASHVKLRKLQTDGRQKFAYSIGEWEYDLAELKRTYFKDAGRAFAWPGTEP